MWWLRTAHTVSTSCNACLRDPRHPRAQAAWHTYLHTSADAADMRYTARPAS